MLWVVDFDPEFAKEFSELEAEVREAILSDAELLMVHGPTLGRPTVGTLTSDKKDKIKNLKELRPTVNKVEWRVGFAFDIEQSAILLAAVAKNGDKRAMKRLIKTCKDRFEAHQKKLKAQKVAKYDSQPKARKGKKE